MDDRIALVNLGRFLEAHDVAQFESCGFVGKPVHERFQFTVFFSVDNLADREAPALGQLLAGEEPFVAPAHPFPRLQSHFVCPAA